MAETAKVTHRVRQVSVGELIVFMRRACSLVNYVDREIVPNSCLPPIIRCDQSPSRLQIAALYGVTRQAKPKVDIKFKVAATVAAFAN